MGEPNVHRSSTPEGPGNGFGTRRSTHPRGAKSGLRLLDSENRSPTGGKIRATDFGLGKPLTHGWQNPGYGFWTRKTAHPRGQNPGCGFWTRKTTHLRQRFLDSENHSPTGSKIRATDFGLGKPLTHGRQNPGCGFWTRKTAHSRGQNPGGKLQATTFGLGKPLTHGGQNPACGFWTRKATHPRGAKSGLRLLGSENHSPTGAKSGLRLLDSENHSPTGGKIRTTAFGLGKPLTHGQRFLDLGKPLTHGGKIRAAAFGLGKPLTHGGQNPGCGFWTRKTTHPREAKSGLWLLDSENHSPTATVFGLEGAGSNPSSQSHLDVLASLLPEVARVLDCSQFDHHYLLKQRICERLRDITGALGSRIVPHLPSLLAVVAASAAQDVHRTLRDNARELLACWRAHCTEDGDLGSDCWQFRLQVCE